MCVANVAEINSVFLSAGRGGEVGLSYWNLCHWDHDLDCFFLDWGDIKTMKFQPM